MAPAPNGTPGSAVPGRFRPGVPAAITPGTPAVSAAPLLPPPAGGPQFTAGSKPHGDRATRDLTRLITNPLAFLTTGISARLTQSASSQGLVTGNNVLQMDTTAEDPYGGWAGSPVWAWYCPPGCSGWYQVLVEVSAASGTPELRPWVSVGGTVITSLQGCAGASPRTAGGSGYVYLLGGVSYVQAGTWAGSSVSTVITAGQQSRLELQWVSN